MKKNQAHTMFIRSYIVMIFLFRIIKKTRFQNKLTKDKKVSPNGEERCLASPTRKLQKPKASTQISYAKHLASPLFEKNMTQRASKQTSSTSNTTTKNVPQKYKENVEHIYFI